MRGTVKETINQTGKGGTSLTVEIDNRMIRGNMSELLGKLAIHDLNRIVDEVFADTDESSGARSIRIVAA